MMVAVHIVKAASVAGVSVDTIRFYREIGLIKSSGRSAGGYRLFDEEDIHDFTFVRHAQELGFSLTEVKELLALRQKHHVCFEVQSMLFFSGKSHRAKLAQLQGNANRSNLA
jgi:DNA-binding transcriptional MerR regulator